MGGWLSLPEPIALRPPSGARLLAAVLSILCFAYGPVEAQTVGPAYPTPPSIAYGELYRDVELASIFPDSKTFPDMIPDATPSKILDEYRAAKVSPGFDFASFVQKHFTGPTPSGPTVNPAPRGQRLLDYVMSLWPILQQTATSVPPYSTLQPLPYPYVVPGGRFREVYYWDSYFTMLGLDNDGLRPGPFSTAIGTPAMRRATNPTRRMSRRPRPQAGNRSSSIAICVRRRNRGGISARGGSPTARRWRPCARSRSCRSI